MTAPNARSIALDCLLLITEEGQFSHVVLAAARDKFAWMPEEERALAERLVHGSVEYLPQLDRLIEARSKTPFRKLKPVIRCILRLSLYQLLYLSRIPAHAVVNEAVKLTERRGLFGLKGFVNAMVRRFVRERDEIRAELDRSQDFALRYALPPWLAERFTAQFGREESEKIAARFLEPAPLTLRLNRTRFIAAGEPAAATEGLTQSLYAPDSFIAEEGLTEPIRQQLAEGLFFVQDLSSSLAVQAAQPKPGERVLDLCAAPGGKSLAAADCMRGEGSIVSADLSPQKVERMRENVARTGFSGCVRPLQSDAGVFRPDWEEAFDLVIADLPCSGLGVLSRKPDIKLRLCEEDIISLRDLQRRFLENAVRYVRPGGRLLYSTCTLTEEEDEANAAWIAAKFHDFTPTDVAAALSLDGSEALLCPAGAVKILPSRLPADGFFISVFRKAE